MRLSFAKAFLYAISATAMALTIACGDVASTGADLALENDGSTESEDAIIGGKTTNDYPAVGAILNNGRSWCTATLVGKRKIVTAAHCVKGQSPTTMQFVLGATVTNPTHRMKIVSLQYHPQYNEQNLTNDIAVAVLASDAPVAPMDIVRKMDNSWIGTNLTFVGYGVDNGYNQTGSGIKREVDMPIGKFEQTFVTYSAPGKQQCNGDSGGPAFYKDASGKLLIAGITSYGDKYCQQYGGSTRIDQYVDFVKPEVETKPEPPVTPPTTPAPSACGEETFEGRCSGTTAIWCENNAIHKTNCRTLGSRCGYSETDKYFSCLR